MRGKSSTVARAKVVRRIKRPQRPESGVDDKLDMTNAVSNLPKAKASRTRRLDSINGRSSTSGETAHDILRTCERPLDPIFSPKVVAVIGATERKRSVGRTVMANLMSGDFAGKIYP